MEKDKELNIEQILKMLPPDVEEANAVVKELLVYCSDKYDFLPELLLNIEAKQVIQLCYIMSDKTIKFPDFKTMGNALRDLYIFKAVKAAPEHKTVKALAERYELTIPATLWILEKVSAKLEEQNPLKN